MVSGVRPMKWMRHFEHGGYSVRPDVEAPKLGNMIARFVDAGEASQAVAAFNATYAKGINPGAVPEMLEALRRIADGATSTLAKHIAKAAIAKATEVQP